MKDSYWTYTTTFGDVKIIYEIVKSRANTIHIII